MFQIHHWMSIMYCVPFLQILILLPFYQIQINLRRLIKYSVPA